MSKLQRIGSFFGGLLSLVCAVIMICFPELGYPLLLTILSISLLLYGIRSMLYYFTMARFMVGGKTSLYKGAILFDLGMFTMMLTDIPKTYIIIYLAAANLFAGGVNILGAVDAKKSMASSWRMKLAEGIVGVCVAAACIVFGKSEAAMVYIYCSGLIYAAVFKIISAFRKTAIVYIR